MPSRKERTPARCTTWLDVVIFQGNSLSRQLVQCRCEHSGVVVTNVIVAKVVGNNQKNVWARRLNSIVSQGCPEGNNFTADIFIWCI